MEHDLLALARRTFPHAGTGPVDVLAARVSATPDATMLIDNMDNSVTNQEFWALISRSATSLANRGVRRQDVVAVIGSNSIDYLASMFAVWALGAIFVPFDPEQPEAAIARSIQLVQPNFFITDHRSTKGDMSLISEPVATSEVNHFEMADIRTGRMDHSFPAPDAWVRGGEIAALYLSSGTTGKPKACMMPADYLLWAGEEFSRAAELGSEDRVLTLGSFAHVNAIWALMGSLVNGTPHAFEQKFSLSRFWHRARETQATVFDYVGTIISILLKPPESDVSPGVVLRAGMGGAASRHEVVEFENRFGVPLLECYGLTECVLPIFQRVDERRLGTIGLLSHYFDAEIIGEDNIPVAQGATGVLRLKPRHRRAIFAGYWRDEASNRAAFDGEWFITGDRVSQDDEGYFSFHGRSGQVIRRRGVNLSIDEIETIVRSHDKVDSCAAVGIPSQLNDEDLVVLVVPTSRPFDITGFADWLRTQVASSMMPDYMQLVPALPMTSSERVQRTQIAGLLDPSEMLAIQPTVLTGRKGSS